MNSTVQDYTTRALCPEEKSLALAFGGGGSRGEVENVVLQEVEKIVGKVTGEIFHLFGAASVGSMNAAYLSMQKGGKYLHDAKDAYNLTQDVVGKIFSRTELYEMESLGGLRRCKYKSDGMVSVLEDYFKETKIGDLGNEICFPAVCTSDFPDRPILTFTRDKALKDKNWNLPLKEVIRCTTAAQSYFPSQKIRIGDTTYEVNDPGLYDNCVITRCESELYRLFDCKRENIRLVFVGTGTTKTPFPEKIENAGSLGYAAEVAPLDMTCNTAMQVEIASNNLGLNRGFWNLNPPIDAIPLDTTDSALLQKIADQTKTWIEDSDELFRKLGKALEN